MKMRVLIFLSNAAFSKLIAPRNADCGALAH
jgi:hypothetical protein